MTRERMRSIVTLYNLKIQDDIKLEDLDHIFEDWEIVCQAYDIRIFCANKSTLCLGLYRGDGFTYPTPISLKIKRKPSKLLFPFTVEELIEYLKKYNIVLRFEPSLIRREFSL
jgi:hypothetical protein